MLSRQEESIQALFNLGDKVHCKQKRTNKWMSNFGRETSIVTEVKGAKVVSKNAEGKGLCRNRTFFKKAIEVPVEGDASESSETGETETSRNAEKEEACENSMTEKRKEIELRNDSTATKSDHGQIFKS